MHGFRYVCQNMAKYFSFKAFSYIQQEKMRSKQFILDTLKCLILHLKGMRFF